MNDIIRICLAADRDFVPCILKVIHTTVDYNNVKVKVIIFDGRMEKVHPLGYEPVR
jgi:hypothetical protein